MQGQLRPLSASAAAAAAAASAAQGLPPGSSGTGGALRDRRGRLTRQAGGWGPAPATAGGAAGASVTGEEQDVSEDEGDRWV